MAGPADKFDKVAAREPLAIPAAAWNALLDLLKSHQQHRNDDHRDDAAWRKLHRQAGVVLIKNDSGTDRDRFSVLAIDTANVPITPTANLTEFQDRALLVGKVPDISVHLGRFAVLLEPIRQGEFGKAVVTGLAICQVSIEKEWHDRADVGHSITSMLLSGTTGAATILWKEPAGGPVRWAIVKVCNRYEVTFKGKIVSREPLRKDGEWVNRWRYFVHEQELVVGGYDGWQDRSDGREVWAYNGVENPNDGTGEEGCGIRVDDDLRLLPAGIGAVVDVTEVRYGAGATALKDYWFHFENDAIESTSTSASGGGGSGSTQDIRSLARRQCVHDGQCQWEVFLFETWRHEPRKKPKRVKGEVEQGCKVPFCTSPPSFSEMPGEKLDRWRQCGATSEGDGADIFLPTWVFDLVTTDGADPVIQLDGTGACYRFEEPDVMGQEATEFDTLDIFDACDHEDCVNCECDEQCIRIEADFEFGVVGPVTGHAEVHSGGAPCDDGYPVEQQQAGNEYIRVTNDGVQWNGERWAITGLLATNNAWEGSYLGPGLGCPFGDYTLDVAISGDPPATVRVVACETESPSSSSPPE